MGKSKNVKEYVLDDEEINQLYNDNVLSEEDFDKKIKEYLQSIESEN